MHTHGFGLLVVSVSLLASVGACSSDDSSGSGGKSGTGGSGGGVGGAGTGGTSAGGTGAGGTSTGGTGTGGTGTGGGNTGGSAGSGTGGGNTGGTSGTGGSGGAPNCAVASADCATCRKTHCGAEDTACGNDTACDSAGQTAGACVCAAQIKGASAEVTQCLATFTATGAVAKAIGDCMVGSCKTPCGL